MCVIIHKPKGESFPREKLLTAHKVNPDGFGYMYYDPKQERVVTFKTMEYSAEDCADAFESLKEYEAVFHWRYATRGDKTEEQAHPFHVLEKGQESPVDLVFMHNGTIHRVKSEDKSESDTQAFNNQILKPILKAKPTLIKNKGLDLLLTDFISSSSKLVFMYGKGEVIFTNREAGSDMNGCWVSNTYSFNGNHRSSNTNTTSTVWKGNTNKNTATSYSSSKSSTTALPNQLYNAIRLHIDDKVTVLKENDPDFCEEGVVKRFSYNKDAVFIDFNRPGVQEFYSELSFNLLSGNSTPAIYDYFIVPKDSSFFHTKHSNASKNEKDESKSTTSVIGGKKSDDKSSTKGAGKSTPQNTQFNTASTKKEETSSTGKSNVVPIEETFGKNETKKDSVVSGSASNTYSSGSYGEMVGDMYGYPDSGYSLYDVYDMTPEERESFFFTYQEDALMMFEDMIMWVSEEEDAFFEGVSNETDPRYFS